jgi:hypothetical protein
VKVPVAAAKQAPAPGFGVLTLHAIKGRLQVLRPDGVVLDLEHTARRGVAGGYPSLDASALVPFAQLGTGTATGSKFLRDDRTWQVPAGGGGGAPTDAQYLTLTTNATLTQERTLSLTLPLSGSDGGAGSPYTVTLSGWSGTTDGDMLYRNGTAVGTKTAAQVRSFLSLVVGTNVQAWDADLDTFAALATDGVLIRSTTWQIATLTAPLTRTGATLSVAAATTSVAGVVELATDGEAIANRAVQGNDSRLGSAGAAAVGLVTWAGVGAGGTLTLDGTTTPTWGTWSTIGGVRTLTVTAATSLEYNSVVWDFTTYPTLRIVTKGAKVAARTMTTTGTGTAYADWNGGDASGGTAGTGAAAVSAASPFGGGQSGAAGRATSGVGGTPGTYNQGVCLGGLGGAGGAAGATAGGAAGAFTRDFTPGSSTYGTIVDFMLRGGGMNWVSGTSATNYQLSGAGGGAAGGNQANGTSGGGGGGAGAQSWSIGSINMAANALYFRCLGGAGAAGVATSGAGTSGGGAGGGGGALLLVIGSVTGTVYVQAHGGNGGNGTTIDADVAAGGAGGNGGLVACIYGAGTAPTGTATGGTGGTGSGGAAAANGTDGTVHIVSAVI